MRKTAVAVAFSLSTLCLAGSAVAQGDAGKTYQGKCVACHATDGSGSAIGKKLGAHDFHSPDVQQQSDAALSDAIAKGKGKMPGYEKTLKPDDIKGLVAYIRTLGK
jgi:mono/diheme cytochrome c family protein